MKPPPNLRLFLALLLVAFLGCGDRPPPPDETPTEEEETAPVETTEPAEETPEPVEEVPPPAPEEPRDIIGLVYEARASRTVNGRPVFAYNPLEDIKRALRAADFSVVEGSTPGEPELHFSFSETRHPMSSFQLLSGSGRVLLDQRVFLVSDETYVRQTLAEMVRGRLAARDEVTFLISQVKLGRDLGHPINRYEFLNTINPLLRLYELTDNRATEVMVSALRSCDPRQRLTAKYALVNLGFVPRNPLEQAAFDMVNTLSGNRTVSMNFLRDPEVPPENRSEFGGSTRLRRFIGQHGAVGIDLLVDDVRCNIVLPHVMWYGGGQISEIRPELILSSMTEDRWTGSDWDPTWSDAVLTSLTNVVEGDHPELTADQETEFKEFATRVLENLQGSASR